VLEIVYRAMMNTGLQMPELPVKPVKSSADTTRELPPKQRSDVAPVPKPRAVRIRVSMGYTSRSVNTMIYIAVLSKHIVTVRPLYN
jgi:hypothetical protein